LARPEAGTQAARGDGALAGNAGAFEGDRFATHEPGALDEHGGRAIGELVVAGIEGGELRLGRGTVDHGEGSTRGVVDEGGATMEAQPGAGRTIAQGGRQPDRRLVIGQRQQCDGSRRLKPDGRHDRIAEIAGETRLRERSQQSAEGTLRLEDRVGEAGADEGVVVSHQPPLTSVKKSTLVAAALREASSRAACCFWASAKTPRRNGPVSASPCRSASVTAASRALRPSRPSA
jgi:hypothetical protein